MWDCVIYEARIDSLQWISKPIWLWPTLLHNLLIYIAAEHMWRGNWRLTCASVNMWFSFLPWPLSEVCSAGGRSGPKLIHMNSLHFSCSLWSHAHFHVKLVRIFVMDCFCFLCGTTSLIWVTFWRFLTVLWWMRGTIGGRPVFSASTRGWWNDNEISCLLPALNWPKSTHPRGALDTLLLKIKSNTNICQY